MKAIAKIYCPVLNILLFLGKINQNRTMKHALKSVEKFHSAFGLGIASKPKAFLDEKKLKLRFDLLAEENEEYFEAAMKNDLVEVADALGDMLYIICGTILEHGMQHKIEEIFNEIQRSNMSKLGENGKPIYREDGKVLKGPNYFKPDIEKILKA
jgi:predicted HAD superfamily Cof-like phosphohydrolase